VKRKDPTHKNWNCGAQYATLHKIFLASKCSYYLCGNPTHKLKLGLHIRGRQLVRSKPPGAIITIGISEKQVPAVKSYLLQSFLSFFWQVHSFSSAFTSLSILCKFAGPKPTGVFFDFSSYDCIVQGHMSITGFALRASPQLFVWPCKSISHIQV